MFYFNCCFFSEKLVNPAFSFQGEGFLRRSNSNSSLNSLVGPDGEQHMRICDVCRRLLERRDKMTEQRNSKPNIVLLYDVRLIKFLMIERIVLRVHI